MAESKISIIAPSKAEADAIFDVEVTIQNIVDYTIYVTPVLEVDGSIQEGSNETIVPGETHSWPFSATMSEASLKLKANSWCESHISDWHLDSSVSKTVTLPGAIGSTLPWVLGCGVGIVAIAAVARGKGR